MTHRAHAVGVLAAWITLVAATGAQQAKSLPEFSPARVVSGTIRVCGSPQMAELLKLYEQGFTKLQPAVHFEEDLKSTLTAVPGVYQGKADIGLLGREIWPSELAAFESAAGQAPLIIDVATGSYDVPKATFALMVFVPVSNPITRLSMAQLERIFSSSNPVRTWGELGLRGDRAARPIRLYGFETDNDKSRIFSSIVFKEGGQWNAALKEIPNVPGANGTDAGRLIVDAVAKDPDAIGISNVHYATPQVKALSISIPAQEVAVAPTRANVANRTYPLTRAVYIVVKRDPAKDAVVEFLRYVLSRQGQQNVEREGNYLPLTPDVAAAELRRLPAR